MLKISGSASMRRTELSRLKRMTTARKQVEPSQEAESRACAIVWNNSEAAWPLIQRSRAGST